MNHDTTMSDTRENLTTLIQVIKELRGPTGCPWDKKQTLSSMAKYLASEHDELQEAITSGDTAHICEELGDLFFVLTMMAEIAADEQSFTLADALASISKKLVRRHPHVFGDATVADEAELRKQWEQIKAQEKQGKYD